MRTQIPPVFPGGTISRTFALLLLGVLMLFTAEAQVAVTYTSSGTFVAPPGVTQVTVECWGGGGRGGTRTSNGRGGGGGGGAYAQSVVAVIPGNSYTVTVGAGSSSNTNPGGDSWFSTSGTILAKGGESAGTNSETGAAGGSSAASIGTIKFAGGNGANAPGSTGAGGGSSAGTAAAGANGSGQAGGTAPAGGGDGGDGGNAGFLVGAGQAGTAPGGGGGGAERGSLSGNQNGGNGAAGRVRLTYEFDYTLGTCMPAASYNAIPDNGCAGNNALLMTVPVSGLPTTLGTAPGNARLVSVSMIVSHTFNADLEISLISPGGSTVLLIADRFGTGNNLGDPASCPGSVLTLTAGGAALTNGNASNVIGTYAPEQNLSGFTGNPNGDWVLRICDDAGDDLGNLRYLNLNFCTVPQITTTSSNSPICAGSPLTLSASATGSPAPAYSWAGTGSYVPNNTSANVTVNNATTGTYTVTATSSCGSTTANVPVVVNALCTATASGGGTVCSVDPLPDVTFTFTGTAPYNFTYDPGGVVVTGHATNTYTVTNAPAGTYAVTALSDANCTGTSFGSSATVTVNTAVNWYADVDGDGFGSGPSTGLACAAPNTGDVTNNTDNCPANANAGQDDGDGDGIGDACDPCDNNTDGDACDDGDPCTTGETLLNCTCQGGTPLADADDDGICDLIDACPNDADNDSDGDGVCGDVDNCPADANAGQDDADLDGVGDVCDICAGFDDNTDTDGDGVPDGCDNCPITANAGQEDTDGDGLGDACDNCPNNVGQQGDACDDNNCFTTGDVLNASCVCAGTPVPCDNWTLVIEAGTNGAEISWEIVQDGGGCTLASGGPYVNGSVNNVNVCVPQGNCFDLTFNDAGGDGIVGGGWKLLDNLGRRMLDNEDNGGCFGSTTTTVVPFCNEPASAQTLIASHIDRENWIISDVIIASANPGVSAQYGIGDQTDDGYQFWFHSPCGAYSRRIFRNHATSGGQGPANAIRATKLALSAMVTSPLPEGELLNVRVRNFVNGVPSAWGPVCRFRLDPNACTPTQLNSTVSSPNYSCGVSKTVGASGNAGKLFADVVTSGGNYATHYRFQFAVPGEGYLRNFVSTTAVCQLTPWATNPLLCGTYSYEVRVQASFNGGVSYCPFGEVCTVTITNNLAAPFCTPTGGGMMQQASTEGGEAHEAELILYPNPNRGDQLFLNMEVADRSVSVVTVDVLDPFGKRAMSATLPVQDGLLNTVLELRNDLAAGIYLVNLTAGMEVHTQRLIIQR